MRKRFTVFCIMGIVFATLAKANAEELRVNVPFNFVVNGKELPAARYTVREVLPNNKSGLAFLGQGTGALTVATEFDTNVRGSELVFRRIGDQYFLSDVVTPSGKLHFVASKKEIQLARGADKQTVVTSAGN